MKTNIDIDTERRLKERRAGAELMAKSAAERRLAIRRLEDSQRTQEATRQELRQYGLLV